MNLLKLAHVLTWEGSMVDLGLGVPRQQVILFCCVDIDHCWVQFGKERRSQPPTNFTGVKLTVGPIERKESSIQVCEE